MESSETLSFQPGSHFQASLRQPLPTVQVSPITPILKSAQLPARRPFAIWKRGGRKLVMRSPAGAPTAHYSETAVAVCVEGPGKFMASPIHGWGRREGGRWRRGRDNAMVKALARAFRWRRMSDEDMHATLEDLGAEHRSALRLPSHVQRLTGSSREWLAGSSPDVAYRGPVQVTAECCRSAMVCKETLNSMSSALDPSLLACRMCNITSGDCGSCLSTSLGGRICRRSSCSA